jgi:hypothetical protein
MLSLRGVMGTLIEFSQKKFDRFPPPNPGVNESVCHAASLNQKSFQCPLARVTRSWAMSEAV